MTPEEELLAELKSINRKLSVIANPYRHAIHQFSSGVFHSLGTLFGTFIIAALFVYFVRQIDLVKPLTNWIENIVTEIRWEQIIPNTRPLTTPLSPTPSSPSRI